jgi:predicted AAA+ superfamily ATPase
MPFGWSEVPEQMRPESIDEALTTGLFPRIVAGRASAAAWLPVNLGKRLTKTPKLYFWDTGLVCSLLGIRSAADLASHPLRGAVFETFVVSEFHKLWLHCGVAPDFHLWRDAHGMEVDLLLPSRGRTRPVEVKAGKTVQSEWLGVLESWTGLASDRAGEPLVIYGGDERQKRSRAEVIGWPHLARFWEELARDSK